MLKIFKIIVSIAFAISFAFIISYTFLSKTMQLGFSMAPYINDHGIALSNRLYKNFFKLKHDDVIIFNFNGQESIKRIYGLPGESVAIKDGKLYVNNNLVENKDLSHSLSSNIVQNVKLGPDEFYVLGDNLDSSKDSRFSDVGNIKRKDIIGKVWLVIDK